jgi:hypothetical protein
MTISNFDFVEIYEFAHPNTFEDCARCANRAQLVGELRLEYLFGLFNYMKLKQTELFYEQKPFILDK